MAIPQLNENQRPVLFTFEQRSVENRNASIEAGHIVYDTVDYVLLSQPGSRDATPRAVGEWLSQSEKYAQTGRIPREWVRYYQDSYKSWKEGQELPNYGTPIRMALFLRPAEINNLISIGIRTIEDAAEMNENAIGQYGMGARDISKRCKAALETSNSLASRCTAQEKEIERLIETVESLTLKINELSKDDQKRSRK